jgi:ferric-dicitrate binding protein FerR (iron transport regulator)
MKCHVLEETLAEHLDGTLDKERTDALLDHIETCEQCRAEFQAYEDQDRQLHSYFQRERAQSERIGNPLDREPGAVSARPGARRLRWASWAAAAIVLCVLGIGGWHFYNVAVPTGTGQIAVVHELTGRVLTLSTGVPVPVAAGDAVRQSQRLKVLPGGYLALRLPDGNIVEANGGTQLALDEYPDRFEVATDRGQVWAHLAAKPPKPFIVRTAHLSAKATGTVFGVAEGLDRSEVDVARGTVAVESGGTWTAVAAGATFASRPGAGAASLAEMLAWSHYPEALASLRSGEETGQPPLRVATAAPDAAPSPAVGAEPEAGAALDYLPADTRYLLEIADLGELVQQFRASDFSALGNNEAVRQWWQAIGGPRAAADIAKEIPLDELLAIGKCLDGTVLLGLSPQGDPLLLADCGANAPRVRALLEQAIAKAEAEKAATLRGGPLSPADDPAVEVHRRVLVSEKWLVASTSPDLARDTYQRLTTAHPTGFAQSAFSRKLRADAPRPRFMLAANLQGQVADSTTPAPGQSRDPKLQATMDLLGLGSLDYLLLSPDFAGHGMNQAARLAFAPEGRTGAMNWLADPSPMRGLTFFSPDVHAFATAIVRNPYQMFEDYLLYLRGTGQDADFQQVLEVVTRNEEFLKAFGGEIAVGVDSPIFPVPNVKVAIEVADQEAFQRGLDLIVSDLLDRFRRQGKIGIVEDAMHKDRTVYSLVIDGVPFTPAWTFIDGYFVAGPGPQFVSNSIDVFESRHSIASDSRLAALLPGSLGMDFSMLLYQDLARSIPVVFREAIAPKLGGEPGSPSDGATTRTAATFGLLPALDIFRDCRAPSVAYAFARPQSVDLYLNAPGGVDFSLGMGVPLVANWLVPRTSIGAVVDKVARAQVGLEILEKAALRFQAENGRLPLSLDELATPAGKYLASVPTDPFSAKSEPLRFVTGPAEGQITLYSIGPDGVDDGGKTEYSIVRQYDGPGDIVVRVGGQTNP